MTLLQQPAKTRPTAKAGRMAGAGEGERARRSGGRLFRYPRKPGGCLGRGTEHPPAPSLPRPGARLSREPTATRGAVVRCQPRSHSSEGASGPGEDYKSQNAVRSYLIL